MELCNFYAFNMEKLFQKIPVELPNQPSPKEERKLLLQAIGDSWYVEKLGQKLPLLKKRKLSKKSQKEDDEINRRLTQANHMGNYCKCQIHWNNIEWVNPKSRDESNNKFYVSSKIRVGLL